MADNTPIEWSDATWNPVNGCSLASPGCTNCYAMKQAHRVPQRRGLTQPSKGGMVWTGEVRFDEAKLGQPLRWKRPRKIFVCAHGDLFHEKVPDGWIDRVFAVMALCPQHTFQVLTKRSARMREYLSAGRARYVWGATRHLNLPEQKRRDLLKPLVQRQVFLPLPNAWLGVSVEDQQRRDRIVDLAQTPAAVRWISGEPLLEGLSLTDIPLNGGEDEHGIQWLFNALTGEQYFLSGGYSHSGDGPDMRPLDWVVVGGESGAGARPMHPDWARSLRDQCAAADVPFFFKQWGDWAPHTPQAGGDLGGDVRDGKICTVNPSGRSIYEQSELTGRGGEPGCRYMARVGKKRAGRLLDGVEHNGMPGQ